MKKIITAAAIAAMAAGFATADATFSVYYRTGIMVADHVVTDKYGHSHGTDWLSNFNGGRSTAGELGFKGSAAYGGLELAIETDVGDKDGKNNTNANAGTGKFTDSNKYLNLTKYNGWINYGNFMLKSGTWESRAIGRVNASGGSHEGSYFGEVKKPGLAASLGTKGNGSDVTVQSSKKQTTMLQYNNKDWGLEARVAYTDSDGTAKYFEDSNYGKYKDEHGDNRFAPELWHAELGYTAKGVGHLLATTKISHNDYTFAGFFEPKLDSVKALTSLIGFTVETNRKGYQDSDKDYNALTAYGLDLRARYDLKDSGIPLAITAMYNWTFGEQAEKNGIDDRTVGSFASWGMLNFKYTLNETVAPFLSVIYYSGAKAGSASVQKFSDPYTFSMRFYGGVDIGKKGQAELLTGICWDTGNMMERGTTRLNCAESSNGVKEDKAAASRAIHGSAGTKEISIPVLIKVSF